MGSGAARTWRRFGPVPSYAPTKVLAAVSSTRSGLGPGQLARDGVADPAANDTLAGPEPNATKICSLRSMPSQKLALGRTRGDCSKWAARNLGHHNLRPATALGSAFST